MAKDIISVIEKYASYEEILNRANAKKCKDEISLEIRVVRAIGDILGENSEDTRRHLKFIAEMAEPFAKTFHLKKEDIKKLKLLAKFHDIGKLSVPYSVLNTEDELNREEWKVIKKHAQESFHILSNVKELKFIAYEALCHHERYDGTGYPNGLKGEEIPLLSRMLSVLDAFEVLIHGRVYKEAVGKEEALKELERCSGTQFDPQIVETFTKACRNRDILNINTEQSEA